ncbi:cobalamin biosynthetic protein CobC [Azospirillum lipoferum]|uniref:threonine-phosphate decarboxylase n=1 Tax=Azospirillum lipoferum TaxID=193 RepID=A0A5A9GGN7_AZOLI|nr:MULTISPECIES: threonine-phosphate decarboxylase CobD [Azospirillum]KAA0593533.1 threonine-phosphate decarboxylase [Azospirillum lipoferum]MCP1609001.1 cobalamin biosynthetic protein CobC [Azospirillum lipoferum]MDW5535686.1 threonine-phosphate decarboxylase CobD [Azospirillum sp. NL1]
MAEDSPATKPHVAEQCGREGIVHGPLLHGGDLDGARAAFPGAPEPWIDLSTGINPWPYPLPPVPRDAWTRLPGRRAEAALRTAAADCYGVPSAELVAAASGSQALIQLLPRLRAPGSVAVLGPTYAEHARCWALAGHDVRMVGEVASADGLTDVLVVVSPNNPDGRRWPVARLLELGAAQAARGGWLVVDEAFADMRPEDSLAPHAGRPGLVILRSFGKFFGLAGLRLGIALAPADLAAALREAIGPWSVSGPGLSIATAALGDRGWIASTRDRLAGAAAELDRLLEDAGLRVAGGTELFRLVEDARAPALYHALGAAGILVRRFEHRPDWLRFGLPGDDAAWQRLGDALGRRQAWAAQPQQMSAS